MTFQASGRERGERSASREKRFGFLWSSSGPMKSRKDRQLLFCFYNRGMLLLYVWEFFFNLVFIYIYKDECNQW